MKEYQLYYLEKHSYVLLCKLVINTGCLLYGSTDDGSYIAQKACIGRDIQ
jgi:hypothetical protein